MSAPPSAQAVLFDLDGVLVDSQEVWFRVLNAAAAELDRPAVPRSRFEESWGQSLEADVREFFPGLASSQVEGSYLRHFPRQIGHLRVARDAAPTLAALHARGLATAVVTNSQAQIASAALAFAGLAPGLVVAADQVPRAKPAPDMVLHACSTLRVPPARALLVGDSRFDREAARAAGVSFVGLGLAAERRVERLGDVLALV